MKWGDAVIIKRLHMKNFGKFHQMSLDLEDGINVIYGENESGKTTIYHFIKSMLFDVEKQRGKAAKFDSYHLYEPWENSLYYEGELKFCAGGRNFRLERGFHKNQKKEILINEEDAEELSIAQGDLLHILDGLNEAVFDNTMAIGQQKSELDSKIAGELKNYTSNFSLSGDGGVNVAKALEKLTKKKKDKEATLRELQNKRQIRMSGLKKEQEYIQADLTKKENQQREYLSLHNVKIEEIEEKKSQNKKKSRQKSVMSVAILLVLAMISILLAKPMIFRILIGVGAVALGIIFLIIWKKENELKDARLRETDNEINRLDGLLAGLKEDIQEKEVKLSNLNEMLVEEAAYSQQEVKLQEDCKALEMAYEGILSASLQLQAEISETLNQKASQILSFITNQKYTDLRMDEQALVRLNTTNKILYEEQVSKGTVDEIHFAVRMAFLELFFPDESMPIILDDAFVMYDNKRLEHTLSYLNQTKRQVILLTCHTREEQLLKQHGIPFHKIILSSDSNRIHNNL